MRWVAIFSSVAIFLQINFEQGYCCLSLGKIINPNKNENSGSGNKKDSKKSPSTTPQPECAKGECNFEDPDSSCAYTEASSIDGDVSGKKWKIVSGQFGNPATGIFGPGEGDYYIASDLQAKETATLEANVNFQQSRIIRFLGYKALQGADLRACCNEIKNCAYEMGTEAKTSDFKTWRMVSFTCPAGTKKIIFHGVNNGNNIGAVGLDNIQIFVPSNDNSNQTAQRVCK